MTRTTTARPDLFEHLRSRQFLFMLPRAVSLQLMHPAISAAILEHSPSPGFVWLHKKRSVPPTIAMAFDPHPESWIPGRIVVTHDTIRGTDADGNRYHSLDPEVFHFQHATYVDSLFETITRFRGPLEFGERRALYARCCSWYRAYGISETPLPATVEEFDEYFRDRTGMLAVTPALTRYRGQLLRPRQWWPAAVPSGAIRTFLHPVAAGALGVRPSAIDRAVSAAFTSASSLG
ncbi:oxygenase MpaB family protein [Dietzia sp. PP-33]|jgi:uncharacterized protein (DUF2236 family)|uniref:oxygenase MpaB family protein n=1 Tax=Dietzia sp. PP-33 TaxID=2957500 RepID=UPI0029ADC546|nr:oxygenase MpaB family protein [Dietzia sp. PP-33]MDX2355816.1 DUF2236 domain-containing protein [Dietzia sp. PP-33]